MTLDLQRKSIAYRLWHAMLCFDRGRLISCIEACKGVWQYAWHHRRGYLLAEWRRKRRKVIELTQINQIFMILRVLRANIVGSATAPRLLMLGCVRLSPHWRRRRLCGASRPHPTINNRGAVADSAIFTLRTRRITWRGWCQAYCHTPLQASMQEINRPYRKKASHATNGMRCFCVASPGSSDSSNLSWEIDYFTITFLPLTIYIPAGRDCRSSCIFTPCRL